MLCRVALLWLQLYLHIIPAIPAKNVHDVYYIRYLIYTISTIDTDYIIIHRTAEVFFVNNVSFSTPDDMFVNNISDSGRYHPFFLNLIFKYL